MLAKEYRMFTSSIIIVFSGKLGAKHWILFMIIRSIHLQFPRGIMSGSLQW